MCLLILTSTVVQVFAETLTPFANQAVLLTCLYLRTLSLFILALQNLNAIKELDSSGDAKADALEGICLVEETAALSLVGGPFKKIDVVCEGDEARAPVEGLNIDLRALRKQVSPHVTGQIDLLDGQEAFSWFKAW